MLSTLLMFGLLGGFFWVINKFRVPIKNYSEVPDGEKNIFQLQPDPANPWIERILSNKLYGKIPVNASQLMSRVSADPKEKIISAIGVSHGSWHRGYLILTSRYVRWIETFPLQEDTFWGLDIIIDKIQMGVLAIGDRLFQDRNEWNPFSSKLSEFVKLHQTVQQALVHEPNNPAEEIPVDNKSGSSLADEMQKLALLHKDHVLSDQEFESAKKRLLEHA